MPDTARPTPWEAEPSALPGEPVSVELMDPPAESYADAAMTKGDASFAAIVAGLGRTDVTYDPALGRAARELAFQQSLLDGLVPLDIVDFLLRSSGAVDRTVEQGYTATTGNTSEAAREQLKRMLGRPGRGGAARVGIGEVWIPGAKLPNIVGVLISRREVEIDKTSRRAPPGEEWTLSGLLPPDHTKPTALVLRLNGVLEPIPVNEGSGRRFRITVPAGNEVGTLHINLGAVGPSGPTTLVQLPVEVGRPLPSTYSTRLPPDESHIKSPEAAEDLAFALLNADRSRFGLPQLTRDRRLDAVARAHSADMRDNHFFAHISPRTGGPGDRLAAAGYKALAHAENIALESSIHAAEANLLASLGHRANILNPTATHVGIGVAARDEDKRTDWHLTQMFARPVTAIDVAVEADRLRDAIARRRRAAGAPALARDPGLERVAQGHALDAAEGRMEGLGKRVLAEAERAGLTPGRAQVWIQRAYDPSSIEAPDVSVDAAYTRAGVGMVQSAADPQGAVGVVLLLASDPG
jgi:uncharacterized protein YkwD